MCKYVKEIWDTLKDLFKGLENLKNKRMTSVVNKCETFTTSHDESMASIANIY